MKWKHTKAGYVVEAVGGLEESLRRVDYYDRNLIMIHDVGRGTLVGRTCIRGEIDNSL